MITDLIGSDSIACIGGLNITIDPKMLICSLCCCINYKCVQCKNKKCLKLFCDNCAFALKMKNENCPFCRNSFECKRAEENLYSILAGMLFYCNISPQCRGKYNLASFQEHLLHHTNSSNSNNNEVNIRKCAECHKGIHSNDPNATNCGVCLRLFCFSNIKYNALNISQYPKDIEEAHCVRQCYECKMAICFNCNKEPKDCNIICDNCEVKCDLCNLNNTQAMIVCCFCNKKLCNSCKNTCKECNLQFCNDKKCYSDQKNKCKSCNTTTNDYTCIHKKYYNCKQCYPKCLKCHKLKATTQCITCNISLCIQECSIKCKRCNKITCLKCSVLCNICKAVLCSKCSISCTQCNNTSLISCLKCNSDTLRKCSFPNCLERLCLNCWNVCNYCNTVFCSKHSNNCLDCQDCMCNQHYQICNVCSKDSSYKKLCLKKCTFKCAFCKNSTNALCDKKKHTNDYVTNYNCEHYVCLNCIKNCFKCKKAVVTCPQCIVNYYFTKCQFCDRHLCNTCSINCCLCENSYCDLDHTCFICRNTIKKPKECINCLYAERLTCMTCDKKMPQCQQCSKLFICGYKCYCKYKKNSKSTDHLCEMYQCLHELIIGAPVKSSLRSISLSNIQRQQQQFSLDKVIVKIDKESVECCCCMII